MIKRLRQVTLFLLTVVLCGTALAENPNTDSRALEILRKMSQFKAGISQFEIEGSSSSDARLGQGLLVANTEEVSISLMRPDKLYVGRFDGVSTKELFLSQGQLTLMDSATGFYAQAETPADVDAALDVALDKFNIDIPLMDLLKRNTFDQIVEPTDEVRYLSSKARIDGVDCHHLVIRSPEVDIQLWIAEGAVPLPRRIIITSKWDGGAPRFVANMRWDTGPDISAKRFKFAPPEGATQIEFVSSTSVEGE
jgi:hypothetical protein